MGGLRLGILWTALDASVFFLLDCFPFYNFQKYNSELQFRIVNVIPGGEGCKKQSRNPSALGGGPPPSLLMRGGGAKMLKNSVLREEMHSFRVFIAY